MVILVLGFANLGADGFAIIVGNYQATKARMDFIQERKREEEEIENMTESERQEIRDIYAKKGFSKELLNEIVNIIAARKKVWVDTMMKEELSLIEDGRKPLDTATSMIFGFAAIGIIPLVPFVFLFVIDLVLSTKFLFILPSSHAAHFFQ